MFTISCSSTSSTLGDNDVLIEILHNNATKLAHANNRDEIEDGFNSIIATVGAINSVALDDTSQIKILHNRIDSLKSEIIFSI